MDILLVVVFKLNFNVFSHHVAPVDFIERQSYTRKYLWNEKLYQWEISSSVNDDFVQTYSTTYKKSLFLIFFHICTRNFWSNDQITSLHLLWIKHITKTNIFAFSLHLHPFINKHQLNYYLFTYKMFRKR